MQVPAAKKVSCVYAEWDSRSDKKHNRKMECLFFAADIDKKGTEGRKSWVIFVFCRRGGAFRPPTTTALSWRKLWPKHVNKQLRRGTKAFFCMCECAFACSRLVLLINIFSILFGSGPWKKIRTRTCLCKRALGEGFLVASRKSRL